MSRSLSGTPLDRPYQCTRCLYAAQHVHVLAEYEHTVTRHDVQLLTMLESCCREVPYGNYALRT